MTNPFGKIQPDAPAAEKRPVSIEQHGEQRTDDYAWLRDDNWQGVLHDPDLLQDDIRAHLEAENLYYQQASRDLEELRARLFAEMRGRVREDDASVPAPDGPYAYAVRYREGGEYPIYVRTARDGGSESVLFDGDAESADTTYFHVGSVDHSPDHRFVACAVDRRGSENYDIRVRDLQTGDEFAETVPSTSGYAVWAADSKSFFYVERENQRPRRVRRHVPGIGPADDEVVYEETDESMFLDVEKSQSGEYVFIESGKGTTTATRYLRADAPPGTAPRLIAPPIDDEQYYVEHHGAYFYMRTNAGGAVDFKIVRAPVETPEREHWEEWLPHRPGRYILDFVPFRGHIVRLQRENALPQIIVSDYDQAEKYRIEFAEAAYALSIMPGFEFDTRTLRFSYESPSTPEQIYDFDLKDRSRRLRKTREIPSGHDAGLYAVERLQVEAADGAQIPVTVLRLRETKTEGDSPLLLYGYGSYGITIPAGFSASVLSLVDRGVIYAIAHIRGGAARGRQWYLDGKLDKKANTFTDFVRVAEDLEARGYGSPSRTVIYGRSAGGLLVGAALNQRPDLFGGAIAAVPFVDPLNTISDAGLPLTPPEWVEWGNPVEDRQAYATIASYSPYENIRGDIDYPPVLATAGLTDFRVTYWEPAKWIAALRDRARGGPFFLKTNMGAGHGGSAARFERLEELTHDYAFALKVFGRAQTEPVGHR